MELRRNLWCISSVEAVKVNEGSDGELSFFGGWGVHIIFLILYRSFVCSLNSPVTVMHYML